MNIHLRRRWSRNLFQLFSFAGSKKDGVMYRTLAKYTTLLHQALWQQRAYASSIMHYIAFCQPWVCWTQIESMLQCCGLHEIPCSTLQFLFLCCQMSCLPIHSPGLVSIAAAWLPMGVKQACCLLGILWPSIKPSSVLLCKQTLTARTSAGSCHCLPQCFCPAWSSEGLLLYFCSSGFKQNKLCVCVSCLNFNEGMFLPVLQSVG